MLSRPRNRRVAKWAGAALCVFFAGTSAAFCVARLSVNVEGWVLQGGRVIAGWERYPDNQLSFNLQSFHFYGLPCLSKGSSAAMSRCMPPLR